MPEWGNSFSCLAPVPPQCSAHAPKERRLLHRYL